jgi:hypothetical protein
MKTDVIELWLKRKRSSEVASKRLMSVALVLAGLVVLFMTFWFAYAIMWFGWLGISAVSELIFGKRLFLTHEWRLVLCGTFLGLLFVQHFVTDPAHWGDYPKRNYVAAPALQWQAGALGGLGFMLAYPVASANMVADILLGGPRLITGAWRLWSDARWLAALDLSGCARLMEFLASRPAPVPYDELCAEGWELWFGQLRGIEGILFLEKGMYMSGELRQELIE